MNSTAVSDYISNWLKDYCTKARCKGFVVGISGGIDSAVTSVLCANTGLDVTLLEMPIHQHKTQVSRAARHIDLMVEKYPNVSRQSVELTPVFDSIVAALPPAPDLEMLNLGLANTRARLRMTALYYFAGIEQKLVAGTGNKIEDFGVGFFTKYGDGGVDLSPIADLTKTQVYELGRELGIIDEIMAAAPTDGLWGDDRSDEDQLGATYPELEWAMDFSGDETLISERQKTVLAIYRRLHAANQHKMIPIPVCVIPEFLKK